jgi:hypothetical protein
LAARILTASRYAVRETDSLALDATSPVRMSPGL